MYHAIMIPDFIPTTDSPNNIDLLKTVVGLSIVLFATFVGIEIRLENEDEEK